MDGAGSDAESGDGRTLSEQQREDPDVAAIIDYQQKGVLPEEETAARELVLGASLYTLVDGVLYHVEGNKTLHLIPPAAYRHQLFQEAHEGPFAGHLREAKIFGQLARHYWWRGMRRHIQQWCRACLTCANRGIGRPKRPLLTPIPVAGPFDRVGVDVVKIPRTKRGNGYIVVFMDYLTKWPEAFATKDQTSLTLAKLFTEEVVSRHGVPRELLSDRGPAFLSKIFLSVCDLLGTKKVNTTAFHPQTDGLVEWFNHTLVDMLAKRVAAGTQEWDELLPYSLFAYRAMLQVSTGDSPFHLHYGRDPQLPSELALDPPAQRETVPLEGYVTFMSQQFTRTWEAAQQSLQTAQKKQKKHHDRHAKESNFEVGDRVFVHTPTLKQGPA